MLELRRRPWAGRAELFLNYKRNYKLGIRMGIGIINIENTRNGSQKWNKKGTGIEIFKSELNPGLDNSAREMKEIRSVQKVGIVFIRRSQSSLC